MYLADRVEVSSDLSEIAHNALSAGTYIDSRIFAKTKANAKGMIRGKEYVDKNSRNVL